MNALKKELSDAYNTIAYDYERVRKKPWPVLQEFFANVGLLEKRGSSILDIGCGNGRHIYWLNKEKFHTYGVDISKNLIRIAKTKTTSDMERKPALVVADSAHLPFKKSAFDIVLLVALLHHLPTYEGRLKTLKEASRILKDGGKTILTVWRLWQRRFLTHIIKEFFRRIIGKGHKEFGDIYRRWKTSDQRHEVYRYYHLFSAKELKELINETQLKIIDFELRGGRGGKENFFLYLEKLGKEGEGSTT